MNIYDAKKKMLQELKKVMLKEDKFGDLGEDLKNKKLQKVTVASDSPEGLKKGLSKAEEILAAKEGMGEEECELEDSAEEEEVEESPEDIKAKIAELRAKL